MTDPIVEQLDTFISITNELEWSLSDADKVRVACLVKVLLEMARDEDLAKTINTIAIGRDR